MMSAQARKQAKPKGGTMKNPLDSLSQTIVLGFVLTAIMVVAIHVIAA
jgi:hypothetical protein